MKELDLSSHIIRGIIRHFRHNDKPLRSLNEKLTSERMISCAASYTSPCGDWGLTQEKSCRSTCCENGVLGSV